MSTSCKKSGLAMRLWLSLPALLALAVAANLAQAAPPTVYTVGNTLTDSSCDYISTRQALAAAAAQIGGRAEIRISWSSDISLGYTWQSNNSAVTISDPQTNFHLVGGYASCGASAPTAGQYTRLTYTSNANDDAYHTMISISNATSHQRRYLDLTNIRMEGASGSNNHGPAFGGGLSATNNVEVALHDSRVSGFHATSGGGVALLGSGTDSSKFPRLSLQDSYVSNNTANNGGGIYSLLGRVTMDNGWVVGNSALLKGGGIALYGLEDAGDVSDDSHFSLLLMNNSSDANTISGNSAGTSSFSTTSGLGGGIYSHYGQIKFESHTGGPGFQSQVLANTANIGGGIYIEGPDAASGGPFTLMRIYSTMFYGNSARGQGGALYMRNAVAGVIAGVGGECQFGFGTPHWGPCMTFVGNQAKGTDGEGAIARGGAIYLHHTRTDGASRPAVNVFRTWFDDNADPEGLAAVAATDGASEISFTRSIFTNNDAKHTGGAASALMYIPTGNGMNFTYNTVLDSNTSTRMFNIAGGTLDVTGSILWGTVDRGHPFHFVWFDSDGANLIHNSCLLVRDSDSGTAGIPGAEYLWTGYAPQLDHHFAPRGSSVAIDYCDEVGNPSLDAYANTVYDVPGVSRYFGNHDLGAVEQTDIVFANSFGNRPDN